MRDSVYNISIDFADVREKAVQLKELSIRMNKQGEKILQEYVHLDTWDGTAAYEYEIRMLRFGIRTIREAKMISKIADLLLAVSDRYVITELHAKGIISYY